MPNVRKYDPIAVEQEFVTGKMSIRTLATKHDVAFSSLAAYARSHDWKGKRIAFQASLSRRGYETIAAQMATEEGQIRSEAVTVLRATLRVYAERLRAGQVQIGVRDAVETTKQLFALLTEPEGGADDSTIVEVRRPGESDADLLRGIAEAARRRLDSGPILPRPPGEGAERAKPN